MAYSVSQLIQMGECSICSDKGTMAESVELTLLTQYLKTLDPAADTSSESLYRQAKYYLGYGISSLVEAVKAVLLSKIAVALDPNAVTTPAKLISLAEQYACCSYGSMMQKIEIYQLNQIASAQ